jgi:hypothetical protein
MAYGACDKEDPEMYHRKLTRIGSILIAILMTGSLAVTACGSDAETFGRELNPPDSGNIQIVTLKDGSTRIGKITNVGENDIKFDTEFGEEIIAISAIREIREVPASSFKEGKFWFPNPNRTRLYFSPTGRMLAAGEGYFSTYYLFFPGVAFGITDNITMGGGFSLFPGVDFDKQLYYLTPKIGLYSRSPVSLAIGALILSVPETDDPTFVGILYGVTTYGTADRSLTIGVGYGFQEDELADKPALMLGGEWRVGRRFALVSENWVIPGLDGALISYGIRFFGEQLSVDLALWNAIGETSIFPGVPYVDFVWSF